MPLIDLKTNLRDLKFGRDRINGGSSNQPYITSPIPDLDKESGEFGFLNQDFILRGGSKAVTDSVKDVERLGKYFLDIRNPSGLLFVAKQNLLSRTAVRTQASGKLVNEGAYTPLSTLAQAGGNAFGLHVNKQGLNPFSGLLSAGDFTPNQYADKIRLATDESFFDSHGRLPVLYGYKILNDESTLDRLNGIKVNSGRVNVLSYIGGPGSTLGIGNTNIRFADQRTGVNNSELKNDPVRFFGGYGNKKERTEYFTLAGEYKTIPTTDPYENLKRFLGLSTYPSIYDGYLRTSEEDNIIPSITSPNIEITTVDGTYNTYSQKQLIDIPGPSEVGVEYNGQSFHIGKSGVTTPGDFRTLLREKQSSIQKSQDTPQFGSLTNAPTYTEKNIEQRVLLGDPGNRNGKNLTSYVNGGYEGGAASVSSYDKINTSKVGDEHQNDLVKFRIGVINNDDPLNVTNIQFRAFLNQISDGYSADWQDTRYIGRGEKFYTYNGFDRKVSLSWTVAAQSKKELIPMYKKLNYLASICAPDYSGHGYMRGNIVTLTIGGYFYEQPGIITGLSYEMNDDNATWEIGIDDKGEYDSSVKELPHLIKVSSFNFIPIHTFVPRLVQNKGIGTKERYIALQAGTSNYNVQD